MKKIILLFMTVFTITLTACDSVTPANSQTPRTPSETGKDTSVTDEEWIGKYIDQMTLTEQIAQMFMISLGAKESTAYKDGNQNVIDFVRSHNPGGYILFAGNISTVSGTKATCDAIQSSSKVPPLIGIDEEGGIVSRLNKAKLPGYTPQPPAAELGASGDSDKAFYAGQYIGQTLRSIGVNLDFAPDADVLTDPKNISIGSRSFGSNPDLVSRMVLAFQNGLHKEGIMSAVKHFPGHGGTTGDSHDGQVYIDSNIEHLKSIEYKPFIQAIENGTDFVLMGHILVPNVDDSGLPASLSHYFITDVLRTQLGFDGIIITDAMDMGAIASAYSSAESAIKAIQAGNDVVLMPKDYEDALNGVIHAVNNGTISKERIRESVARIIRIKLKYGLIVK